MVVNANQWQLMAINVFRGVGGQIPKKNVFLNSWILIILNWLIECKECLWQYKIFDLFSTNNIIINQKYNTVSHCCFLILQTFFTFSFLIFCEHWTVQCTVSEASIYLRIVFVGRGEVLFGPTAADPLFAIKETVWRKASCVLWVDNEKINQIYFSVSFQGFNYWTNYLSTLSHNLFLITKLNCHSKLTTFMIF